MYLRDYKVHKTLKTTPYCNSYLTKRADNGKEYFLREIFMEKLTPKQKTLIIEEIRIAS